MFIGLGKEGAREETNFKKVETHKAKAHAEETFALKVDNDVHRVASNVIVAAKPGEDPGRERSGSVAVDRASNKSQIHDDEAPHRSGSDNGSRGSCGGGGSVSKMSQISGKTPSRRRHTPHITPPHTPRQMSKQSDLPDEEQDG